MLAQRVTIAMSTPEVKDLEHVADVLSGWQYDGGPLHLHPGDLGWHSLRGAAMTAGSLRVWSREGKVLAIGLLDGPDGLLRMAVDPDVRNDEELSRHLVADVQDPQRGVLAGGDAIVEARGASRFAELLAQAGWRPDEPWTPLHRDLSSVVDEDPIVRAGVRIETVGPDRVDSWVAVHWSAFKGTPFTEQDRRDFRDWWLTMANGPFYQRATSLVAFDDHDDAVSVTTVWSAGPRSPRAHRAHGGPPRPPRTWLWGGGHGGRRVGSAPDAVLKRHRVRRELQHGGPVHLPGGRVHRARAGSRPAAWDLKSRANQLPSNRYAD